MNDRQLPPDFDLVPDDFHFYYTMHEQGSRYGLGHLTEVPYFWKRVGLYRGKWMPVDVYFISTRGELYSARAGRILKADPPLGSEQGGYPTYKIKCTDGRFHHLRAHVLVCDAFLSDVCLPLLPYINHRDLNKTNSSLPNLERTNRSLNIQHAHDMKREATE